MKDMSVFITGISAGLGKALALALSNEGARVAGVARNKMGVYAPTAIDPKIKCIEGDISDKNQIHRIHAEALSHLGHINVLINNASTLGPTPLKLLPDTNCEDLHHVLETNLMGPFRLTKLVLPSMLLKGFGIVVNISSDAAVNAYPRWGAYSASKAALDHLTRVFQAELSETPIQFLSFDPGDMDTALHASAIPDADRTALRAPAESARLLVNQIKARLGVSNVSC